MTSEQQYYEAKVFLTAYNEALRTIEYQSSYLLAKLLPIGQLSTSTKLMSDTCFCRTKRERYGCWDIDSH